MISADFMFLGEIFSGGLFGFLVSLLGPGLVLVVAKVVSQLVRPKNATNTSNDNSFFIVRIFLCVCMNETMQKY